MDAPRIVRATIAALLLVLTSVADAQAPYPSRPVRLIVPFAPGGASDVVARIITPVLAERLGQPVVIENRGGASGNLGMIAAAKAAPDGYTVFLGNIGAIAINPGVFPDLGVNPLNDFIPVSIVADVPSVLLAHRDLPVNTVRELEAYAKANPGVLNWGSTGSGALSRLEMDQLRRTRNLDVVHIPYKGGAGPAITGLLRGEIHVTFISIASVMGQIQGGKVKVLAVSTPTRLDLLPDVPTMAESGHPDMVSGSWQGLFVPAGTPRPIVDRLHAAITATLESPETRQRVLATGAWVATSRTPEDFGAFVRAESVRWTKAARDAGARPD